jgi:conjugal transfer ATP-binding protein TraC
MDLDELRSKKDLQEVVLLTLIYQIQQEIVKERIQRKIVVVDEAWDLLTGGNTTAFLENGYRRFRKYRGACISITQSINDFYKHPSGRAILENSDFFFLLRQRAESIEALKESKRVMLSEGMYELLKSVHTDSGNYSEIFVYSPTGIAIGRLTVDRFTQLLYSTKAEEFAQVKELVAQGKTVIEAIRQIIEREKRLDK